MQARKTEHGQNSSNSLRTSQPSSTQLSNSGNLIGTPVHMPESSDEKMPVAIELPPNGTGSSMSVRPAQGHATQVIGDLSRLGTKLRGSRESHTNKRTQSDAGIGEEDDANGSISKRQRNEDTAIPRTPAPGSTYDNPIGQTALQAVPRPVEHISVKPAETALDSAPVMQAQTAMAEARRMASSTYPFQPEKISELFQHLCRAQLWPLLKLEEQRVLYLMSIPYALQAPYPAASSAGTGKVVPVNARSTSMTTLSGSPTLTPLAGTTFTSSGATAQRPPFSNPPPTTRPPVPSPQTTQAAPKNNASKVDEFLLPHPPNPPSPEYAQQLLSSLPEATQDMMRLSADRICKSLSSQPLDPESVNNMTAFTAYLVEIVSHGGLPQLAGEVDSIVQALLEFYKTSHRRLEAQNAKSRKAEDTDIRGDLDPIYAYVLRLLPKHLQFTRVLGKGINSLPPEKRTHLGLSRRFNAVLKLIMRRQALLPAEFERRLNAIIDAHVKRGTRASAKSASATESTPTVPVDHNDSDSDDGSDGAI
jgi:hypothetical protein